MKRIIPTLLFIFISFILCGQELKTKKETYNLSTEVYQVQKKTKEREGSYFEFLNSTNDTLIKGQYHNNEKIGIWTFYDIENQPFLKYDYSKDTCLWVEQLICKKDSFPILAGDDFKFALLDRPPLFLGYRHEFKTHLVKDYRIPINVLQSKQKFNYTLSFVVSKMGTVESLQFKDKPNQQISDLIMETNHNWIPGILNGKPVDTKLYVIYRIGPSNEIMNLPESPLLIRADIGYLELIVEKRLERINVTGTNRIGGRPFNLP